MAEVCVFCGERPQSKTKEHVIPKWLIEMTGGDGNRHRCVKAMVEFPLPPPLGR
jgi:hypothetical protein